MVCNRCIKAVTGILNELNIGYEQVLLGEALLQEALPDDKKTALQRRLHEEGFELIDNKTSRIIERIKGLLIQRVKTDPEEATDTISHYLASQLHLDYSYLSTLFSAIEGITIEKYYIVQKLKGPRNCWCMTNFRFPRLRFDWATAACSIFPISLKK